MTYKVIFAIAAFYNYKLKQMDIKTAFLHGDLEEEVYVVQPTGYEKEGGKVCKLKKALYGLKQSPRLWYEVMHRFLASLGYTRIQADNSVFRNATLIVAVYVDDILMCGPDKGEIRDLKAKLSNQFEMTDCGACKHYLGMLITRNRSLQTLTLSQETYLTGVLKDFGLQDAKAVTTPMEPGAYLATGIAEPGLITQYQKAIGSLMYAMTQMWPDIAYAVSTLSQFAHNPNNTHWKALKRVFRYVWGTLDVVIEYKSSDRLGLLGYSDSDWGGDLESRRSMSGYVFKMANGPVSWSSKRQKTVALSSCEAEYMALTEATKEAVWMHGLLKELGLKGFETVTIRMDNQGAIALAKNPEFHARTKHIDICHHFIREVESRGLIHLDYIPTSDMTADRLTKPLPTLKFTHFIDLIGLTSH